MGYAHLPLARCQLCWVHLKRDFPAHAEGRIRARVRRAGLALCERVFWAWEVFQNTADRREMKLTIRRLRREYKHHRPLRLKERAQQTLPRGMARNLLKARPALWTFGPLPGGSLIVAWLLVSGRDWSRRRVAP